MPAATDAQSLTNAAEQAAASGDFATAAEYLRLAVELQESAAGPIHPDLANTLNNLGVVYERLDRPADAERCYRRAHAIASIALEPDHPFVALSAKNLREFCEARGIPIEPPAVAPAAAVEPVRAMGATDDAAEADEPAAPPSQTAARVSPKLAVAAVLVLVAILAVVLATSRSRSTSGPTASSAPPPVTKTAPGASDALSGGADQPPLKRRSAGPSAKAEAPPPQASAMTPAPVAPVSPVASPKRATPAVTEAALCRSVEIRAGEWQCDAAGEAPGPGTFYFYTRVTAAQDATIEHRWYRNDRLYQSVPLRVRPNQRGFRTYSRMTIGAERAGEWRVEIRTADGALLHEERFRVGP